MAIFGTDVSIWDSIVRERCRALLLRRKTQLLMQSLGEKGMDSISTLPASIFEKSRISLIKAIRVSPLDRMASSISPWSGSREVSSRRSIMPIIPLRGVRIS